jgi:uncharacterized protein (TIGR02145 family)
MKNIYKLLLCIVACTVLSVNARCQDEKIKEICGSDVIRISLDNYQFGKIDWQESYDTVNWVTILDQHDTVMVLNTTEEKYIRGRITTSECDQVYSNYAHINQIPAANAGMDRDVMGDSVCLLGNNVKGASGTWEILNGESVALYNAESAMASVASRGDTLCELTWTLENQCGSTTDTVIVNFIENTYSQKHILIDSTDSLILAESDTLAGIYCYHFADLLGVISDPDVLIGLEKDGFLRKVDSIVKPFSENDSIYKYYTSQGTIEDIILDGVFSDYDITQGEFSTKKSKPKHILSELPGRRELLTNPKYREGVYVYYFPDEYVTSSLVKSVKDDVDGFIIELDSSYTIEKENVGDLTIGMEGFIRFDPNFVFSYTCKWFKLKSLKAGMDNATLETRIALDLNGKIDPVVDRFDLGKDEDILKKTSRKVIIAGSVPILIKNELTCNLAIEPVLEATLDANYTWGRSSSFSAYLNYKRGSGVRPVLEKGPTTTTSEYSVVLEGNAGVGVTLTTGVSMSIYGCIGPYLEVPISVEPGLCATSWITDDDPTPKWTYGFNVPFSIDANIGVKVKLFRKILLNSSVGTNLYEASFNYPYSLELVRGNHQVGYTGEPLEHPFELKLKNNWGGGAPGIPVYWSVVDGDGILGDPIAYAGSGGMVSNSFTLGTSDYNRIKVEAYNCDMELLEGAEDLFIEVNSGCKNSSVQLAFDMLPDMSVQPVGKMGAEPYAYSLDGINYSEAPIIMGLGPASDHGLFYLRDAEGCLAWNRFEFEDSCAISNLAVSLGIEGTNITATGTGGFPPYLFALDSIANFGTNNLFQGVTLGAHELFIMDAAGCTVSQPFALPLETSDSLVAFYPFNGNANDESGNGHDGIVSGAELVPDRYGNPQGAYFFDSDDVIRIAADDDFIMEGDFSINFWMKADWYEGCPLSIGESFDSPGSLHLECHSHSYPILENGVWFDGSSLLWRSFGLGYAILQGWCQFTLVRKGGHLFFYINLELMDAAPCSSGEVFRSCDIRLGNNPSVTVGYNGALDDVRIYDRALTMDEMAVLYFESGYNDGSCLLLYGDPRDGNWYRKTRIGEQVWMAENLRWLPEVTASSMISWVDPMYYVYDYQGFDVNEAGQANNYHKYGVLYNPVAAETACPEGWKLPSAEDWEELREYTTSAIPDISPGLLLKSTSYWNEMSGSDNFDFSGLPGGYVAITEGGALLPFSFGEGERGVWHIRGDTVNVSKLELDRFDIGPMDDPVWNAVSVRCIQE